ncbi:MAG: hypothetical protein J6P20_03360 [Oscillospiraceae bacterium]|nr:hypothetical protein [Oscillospiraceae bacterium]
MTKAAALYQFFSSFDLDAYEENSVYALESPPEFPYLTYEMITGFFGEYDITLTFSLWYRSTSWSAANAKVEEISAEIGREGKRIPVDGGYLLILRGSPFAQSMGDPSDDMIKRKIMNINVRYYTSN